MSDLLNSASLVMIPSGYAEDKVYSVVPSDGSGDLSFTRASNGTRVNSAGLVEVAPWNLVEYSSDLSNGAWSGSNITKTTGQTDPNGGTTAATIDPTNGTNAYLRIGNSVISGNSYTWSFYIKGSTSGQQIVLYTENGIDLNETKNLTTSWQRFEVSGVATSTASTGLFILCGGAYGLTDAPFNVAFPQFNIGSTAKPYFPTTDRLNVPRLTYQNGGGGCPSLLLEKQSTNLVLYSQDLTQSGQWLTLANAVVSSTKVTSPDGTQNANQVIYDGTTNCRAEQVVGGVTSGADYTMSVYMRVASGTASVEIGHGASTVAQTVTTTWQRFSVTQVPIVGTSYPRIMCNSAKTVEIWGAQLEAGSYATSYIVSTSSSATRVADACFKTGISSLIGQTEGTIFVDFVIKNDLSSTNRIISITESNWLSGGSVRLDANGANFLADVVDNNAGSATITYLNTNTQNTRYKVAIAYKQNDCQMYVNGINAGSDTSTSGMPSCSEIYLNELGGGFPTVFESNQYNQAVLFKTRLTNAELASLTTL